MNSVVESSVMGLISFSINEWIAWNEKKKRDAAWKPGKADVDEFLAKIAGDTPERLKAQAAAARGIVWPPPPTLPPDASGVSSPPTG